MTDLPPPLTPANCDLRNFPFMPLDVEHLLGSYAWIMAENEPMLAFYFLNLWIAGWRGYPAASLPDDDLVLANRARCPIKLWKKAKNKAMHGWIKCSDGRFYHPFIAEKALVAWASKEKQKDRTEAARIALNAKRSTISTNDPSVTDIVTMTVTSSVTASNRDITDTEIEKERKKEPPKSPKGDACLITEPGTELALVEPARKIRSPKPEYNLLSTEIPHWMPLEAWNGYVNFRRTIKKPLTERAMQLLIKQLSDYQVRGLSVEDALDQSVKNGWQGVFDPKVKRDDGKNSDAMKRDWGINFNDLPE